ncbi:MAG: NADH-quinone oxidoreductase subunit NuoH [Actinomycetota bacterium]|nr:NADH-quinone oxidoreductase subunit NuoH [Actinomycetota bacterium]
MSAVLHPALLGALTTHGDPLYNHGVGWFVWVVVVIKVLVAFAVLLVSVMLMIWFERKLISDMQSRIGPNRAGPWGMLQTMADGIKLFFKEDLVPDQADRFVFKLAPYLSLVPALLIFTVVPVGGIVTLDGHAFELQVADPPIGILLVLAMSSIAVYGVMLAGWSSGSKYPLLGSVRASAQMISYEAALGISVVTVVLITGSLSTRAMVESQATNFWDWNLIRLGFVPFFLFFTAITAELTRPPFDLTEAESELVGGYHTEYSSIRFALFFLAEFMNVITMSAIVVTLFLGGPDGPVPHLPSFSIWFPIVWFLAKVMIFLFVYVWLRAALPRLRYDQLMTLGWKYLIPISLGWLMIVAGFVVAGWWGIGIAVGTVIAAGLLLRAFTIGRERVNADEAVLPPLGRRPQSPERPTAGGA